MPARYHELSLPYDVADWSTVPDDLHFDLSDYIERGKITNPFLRAIIDGHPKTAILLAGDRVLLTGVISSWLYIYAPHKCWGSAFQREIWTGIGGLLGCSF